LHSKVIELQTENLDLKQQLQKSASIFAAGNNQKFAGRMGSAAGRMPFYQRRFSDFQNHSSHFDKSKLICTYCMSRGHISSSCFIKKNYHVMSHLKWIPKHDTNNQGPKKQRVPKSTSQISLVGVQPLST